MKRIIKERERTLIVIDYIVYALIACIGHAVIEIDYRFSLTPDQYLNSIFFAITIITFLAYEFNRKRKSKEFIVLSIINLVVALFLTINKSESLYIYGDVIIFYGVAILAEKLYSLKLLLKRQDVMFLSKLMSSILLIILTIYGAFSLYSKTDQITMIYGYYVLVYALLSFVEPIFFSILNHPKMDKYLSGIFNIQEEEKPKLKEEKIVPNKRIKEKKTEGIISQKEKAREIYESKNKENQKSQN